MAALSANSLPTHVNVGVGHGSLEPLLDVQRQVIRCSQRHCNAIIHQLKRNLPVLATARNKFTFTRKARATPGDYDEFRSLFESDDADPSRLNRYGKRGFERVFKVADDIARREIDREAVSRTYPDVFATDNLDRDRDKVQSSDGSNRQVDVGGVNRGTRQHQLQNWPNESETSKDEDNDSDILSRSKHGEDLDIAEARDSTDEADEASGQIQAFGEQVKQKIQETVTSAKEKILGKLDEDEDDNGHDDKRPDKHC